MIDVISNLRKNNLEVKTRQIQYFATQEYPKLTQKPDHKHT
jgi:hypothetical protein